MPVTQHNCWGMLCECQGLPLHREKGDEVLGPDSKWLALPAVSQKLAKGAQKRGCVCTVSSGTSNGAMLQNGALPNSSREEVQTLHLPALMCSSS